MPKRISPLTDTQVRNLKATNREVKIFDGNGLFLVATPSGGKLWRMKYRIDGKEKLLSFGPYPHVSLALARQKRDEAKKLLAQGIDPREAEKEDEIQSITFQELAEEWLIREESDWTPKHKETVEARLKAYIFPHIGKRPIAKITAPEALSVLKKIEAKGIIETSHRVKQICGQVFRFGVGRGVCEHDVTAGLKGQLTKKPRVKHMAAITDRKDAAGLLRAIDDYSGSLIVKCALRLAPLLFVRPGELRHMEWAEIDFEADLWTIPAEKMKMRKTHSVPLAPQSLAILEQIRPHTGEGKYVFPSARTKKRPISDMAINAALRRMGFNKEEMTGHGFRSMASSLLHEAGWDSNLIELQLAHRDTNTVRAIYNRAERLEERRKLMDSWADMIDGIKTGARILQLGKVEGVTKVP